MGPSSAGYQSLKLGLPGLSNLSATGSFTRLAPFWVERSEFFGGPSICVLSLISALFFVAATKHSRACTDTSREVRAETVKLVRDDPDSDAPPDTRSPIDIAPTLQ